jgi:hypothetical protein
MAKITPWHDCLQMGWELVTGSAGRGDCRAGAVLLRPAYGLGS